MGIFIFFQIILLIIVAVLTLFLVSNLYAFLRGSPFVASRKEDMEKIVLGVKRLKFPFKRFVDLGCGDGEIVFLFSKKLNIPALGIDINPLLIIFAKLKKIIRKAQNVRFQFSSFEKYDPKDGDLIYLYHLPKLLYKIAKYLETKGYNKNIMIISYQFEINNPKFEFLYKIKNPSFAVYFYKIKK